ncbi:AzlC family ABC transporter permease [Aquisalimonas sp.]|uniref:AzlC family ABC transporter permease n=1 Tax=Aquisalimonas sp. TaxID=1872621 RepID=UPI0025BCFDC7|nr:AzlC family ABC transporter permease [Aquisalimonas sp.]
MEQPTTTAQAALAGARASSPVTIAYAGIGLAAGVVGTEAGLSAAEVGVLSLLLFAGSAQFVFADLYTGALVTLVGTVFLVNLRHLLYATALSPRVQHLPLSSRIAIGAQLTDETFALGTSLMGQRLQRAAWMIALNVTAYSAWVSGNVAGALLGALAGAIEVIGLEFALAGMFAALLLGQIRAGRRTGIRCAVAGLAGVIIIALDSWQPHPLNLMLTTVIAASAGVLIEQAVDRRRGEEAA